MWIIAAVGVAGPGHAGPVRGHLALDCGFRLGRLVLAGEKKRMLDGVRNSGRLQRRIVFLGPRENVTINRLTLRFEKARATRRLWQVNSESVVTCMKARRGVG